MGDTAVGDPHYGTRQHQDQADRHRTPMFTRLPWSSEPLNSDPLVHSSDVRKTGREESKRAGDAAIDRAAPVSSMRDRCIAATSSRDHTIAPEK